MQDIKKIELTKEEIDIADDIFFDTVGFLSSEETLNVACSFIKKADSLEHELNAFEERGGDLIVWFWGKYLKLINNIQLFFSVLKCFLSRQMSCLSDSVARAGRTTCPTTRDTTAYA